MELWEKWSFIFILGKKEGNKLQMKKNLSKKPKSKPKTKQYIQNPSKSKQLLGVQTKKLE
jgi:hypothetical protein